MKKLFVITPTGDRPEAFALCVKYMNRQTRQPDLWLIVDDGKTDAVDCAAAGIAVPHEIIKLPPMAGNSIVRNLRESFARVPDDAAVCVMEDDDFYPANYLETMAGLLEDHPVAASRYSHYYNVRTRQWRIMGNTVNLPMHGNGFSGEGLAAFKAMLATDDSPHIDSHFSESWNGDRVFNDAARPIHITGFGGGRPGTTPSHRVCANNDHWNQDPQGAQLIRWVGAEDAKNYLDCRAGKIYVFSNVRYPAEKKLAVEKEDLLVFLNRAFGIEYYADHPNRMVCRRSPKPEYGDEILSVKNRYVFEAGLLGIPSAFLRRLKGEYDWHFPGEKGKAKCMTTGYMVVKYLENHYPGREIVLVNFGYQVKNSTYRCPWHNWEFEAAELAKFRHVFTAEVNEGEQILPEVSRRVKSAAEAETAKIFTMEGSDKMTRHDYGEVYADVLGALKGKAAKIAEVGVFRGASLRAMRQILPDAELYGIDLSGNARIDGATVIHGDGYGEAWEVLPVDFDLIIDDGSHKLPDMLRGIPVFREHLKDGGILLIEDVPSEEVVTELLKALPGAECIRTAPTSEYDDDRIVLWTKGATK